MQERTQNNYPWFDLKPIITWKTVISHINFVSAGQPIGYDRTFIAKQDMRIGMIPIGYYDGYDFRLFNKGSVLIHGQYAPIVGRIAMNLTIIDITDISSAKIDDEVIGADGDTLESLSDQLDSLSSEDSKVQNEYGPGE